MSTPHSSLMSVYTTLVPDVYTTVVPDVYTTLVPDVCLHHTRP